MGETRGVKPTRTQRVPVNRYGTITENQPSDATTISKIYYGGHATEVTAEEVAALTAAGYGAYIT
jgi:hypothetical protein